MRKLISIFALTLCCISGNELSAFGEEQQNQFSVRVAGDLLRPGDSPGDIYDGDFGANISFAYQIQLNNNLYLEPAVIYYFNRFGPSRYMKQGLKESQVYAKGMQTGLRLPVHVGWNFYGSRKSRWSIALGPMICVPLAGKVWGLKTKSGGKLPEIGSSNLYSPNSIFYQKRLDLALNLHLGYHWGDYEVYASNSKGLLNLAPKSRSGELDFLDQNNLCLGVGWSF